MGEDAMVVAEMLRHAKGSRATSIYAHVTVKLKRGAANKLSDRYRRNKSD
jgi:hypothetical protein